MESKGVKRLFGRGWAAAPALVAAVAALFIPAEAPAAQEPGREVFCVRLEGELDLGMLALLQRSFREARGAGQDRIVIEIDTPGGEIQLMRQLSNAILDAADGGLTPVAWINDQALSAGALIAMSCDTVYMRERATIGSSQPITIGLEGIAPVSEKMLSAVRANFRAVAESQRRPPSIAEAMVDAAVEVREVRRDGVTELITGTEWDDAQEAGNPPELISTVCRRDELLNLTATKAVRYGIADGVAETINAVLENDGYRDVTVTYVQRTRSETVLGLLNQLAFFLLAAGMILAFVEMKMPGFGLPGILSLACFVLLFSARYLVGLADIPDIVLAALGIALIAGEILILPGTIWLGLSGGVLLAAGLILSQTGPGFSLGNPIDQRIALESTGFLILTALASLATAWALSRHLPSTPPFQWLVLSPSGPDDATAEALPEAGGRHGELAIIGSTGLAKTALRPVGKVVLDADSTLEYEARSPGAAVDAGARVRVISASGGRLVVEPDLEGEPT